MKLQKLTNKSFFSNTPKILLKYRRFHSIFLGIYCSCFHKRSQKRTKTVFLCDFVCVCVCVCVIKKIRFTIFCYLKVTKIHK